MVVVVVMVMVTCRGHLHQPEQLHADEHGHHESLQFIASRPNAGFYQQVGARWF